MRPRRQSSVVLPFLAAVSLTAACLLGWAPPAGASGRLAAVVDPGCITGSVENMLGAQLVNNQIVNGTWRYATGVACGGSNVADIALYEELDFNGVKVDSK